MGVYRSMRKADDGYPEVGDRKTQLGVTAPGDPPGTGPDVHPDEHGMIDPSRREGMSVAPHWTRLPKHRIPRRLAENLREKGFSGLAHAVEAEGTRDSFCWRYGRAEFEDQQLGEGLQLVVTGRAHAVIAPLSSMPLDQFRQRLASTRTAWLIDET